MKSGMISNNSTESCASRLFKVKKAVPGTFHRVLQIYYFKLFATSDFYQIISDQANLYAEQNFQSNPDDKSSSSWTPVTATEIQHFLVVYFLIRIVQKLQIQQDWSIDPILQTSVFNQIMTRNRFQKILQFLNFIDNSNYDVTDPGCDKFFKARDIVEFLVASKPCTSSLKTFQQMKNFYFTKGGYHLSNILCGDCIAQPIKQI